MEKEKMERNRILVVDDNSDLAEAIADVLDIQGYRVDVAFNSKDALEKYEEEKFDIVLMDIKLPDKNGVDSFIEMKKIHPDAVVAFMTSYKEPELINRAVANGVCRVFYKPFNIPKLLKVIDKIKRNHF
jgi:DNA-binding response OmpR family regulator